MASSSTYDTERKWYEIVAPEEDKDGQYYYQSMFLNATLEVAMKTAVGMLCRRRNTTPGQIIRRLNEDVEDECCDDMDKEDKIMTNAVYAPGGFVLLDQILSSQGCPDDDSPGSHITVSLYNLED